MTNNHNAIKVHICTTHSLWFKIKILIVNFTNIYYFYLRTISDYSNRYAIEKEHRFHAHKKKKNQHKFVRAYNYN